MPIEIDQRCHVGAHRGFTGSDLVTAEGSQAGLLKGGRRTKFERKSARVCLSLRLSKPAVARGKNELETGTKVQRGRRWER